MEVPEVLGEESSSFVDNLDIEHFDGGGFSIVGVIVGPYCNIVMVIMSVVFIVGGILLTVIHSIDKQQVSTENNLLLGIEERKFAGPLIITIGAIMLNIGIFLQLFPSELNPRGSQILQSMIQWDPQSLKKVSSPSFPQSLAKVDYLILSTFNSTAWTKR